MLLFYATGVVLLSLGLAAMELEGVILDEI